MNTPCSPSEPFRERRPGHAANFRQLLQNELTRRCRENSSYSLRAYARSLEIEPSALSKILNGARRCTPAMVKKLALRLHLTPEETMHYLGGELGSATAASYHSRSAGASAPDYRQVELDHFHVISDWYHYAILELTQTSDFHSHPRLIAKALGISVTEVKIAAERLRRLGFLEIDLHGRWIDRSGEITTVGSTPVTHAAYRHLQKQVLEMAITAMEEVPIERRDQSSMTMAIDSSLLPEAKRRVLEFRRELCKFLQSSKAKDDVFHLGVALYPVTRKRSHEDAS